MECGAKHCSYLHEEEEKKNKIEISEEKQSKVKKLCDQKYGITNSKEYFDKQLDSSDSE